MASCNIEKIKINVAAVASFLCLCAACILISIGGVFYAHDQPKLLNYASTICEVQSSSWTSVKYIQMYNYIIQYVPSWSMNHNGHKAYAIGTKRFKYSSSALAEAQKYKVHSWYLCWYNTKKPTEAQWDKPTIHRAAALISCGAILICLTIVFLFLTHRFIRQEQQKNEQKKITRVHITFLK